MYISLCNRLDIFCVHNLLSHIPLYILDVHVGVLYIRMCVSTSIILLKKMYLHVSAYINTTCVDAKMSEFPALK